MLTSPIFAVTCSQEPIKLILELKNLRTLELSGAPYQWGPRHETQQPPHRYATVFAVTSSQAPIKLILETV